MALRSTGLDPRMLQQLMLNTPLPEERLSFRQRTERNLKQAEENVFRAQQVLKMMDENPEIEKFINFLEEGE